MADSSSVSGAVVNSVGRIEAVAARSATLAAATNIGLLVLKFVSSALLARLLLPREFGVANLAWVVLTAVTLLSDVGLDTAVVRSERGEDPKFLDVVWTVGLARSVVLWAVLVLAAYPLSVFYEEPRFVYILPAIGLVLVIEASRSTFLDVAERHLDQTPRMRLEVIGIVAAFVVQLGVALVYPSVIALVAGALVSAICRSVESHRLNPGRRNRLAWDASMVDEIIGFGKWVFLSTAFTFFATQGDRLVLGKVMSLDLLGVYGIACAVALVPNQIHGVVASRVVFPLIVAYLRASPKTLEAKLRSARTILLAVMLFAMVVVMVFAGPLFELVYPGRFELAGTLAPVIACISWIGILQNSVDRLPLAHGEGRLVALVSAVSMVARITGGFVGFSSFGLFGFLGGIFVGACVEYAVAHIIAVRRYKVRLLLQDLRHSFFLALVVAGVFLMRHQPLGIRLALAFASTLVAGSYAAIVVAGRVREARRIERSGAENAESVLTVS